MQSNGPVASATPSPYVPVSTGYGPHSLPAYAHQAPPPAPPPAHTLSTAVDLMNTGKVPRQSFMLGAVRLPGSHSCSTLPWHHCGSINSESTLIPLVYISTGSLVSDCCLSHPLTKCIDLLFWTLVAEPSLSRSLSPFQGCVIPLHCSHRQSNSKPSDHL